MPNVFTPETLAQRWQCSSRHVRNLIKQNRLAAFRVGGKLLRIKREDVERFEQCSHGESPVLEESLPSHLKRMADAEDIASTLLTDMRLKRLRPPSMQS